MTVTIDYREDEIMQSDSESNHRLQRVRIFCIEKVTVTIDYREDKLCNQ